VTNAIPHPSKILRRPFGRGGHRGEPAVPDPRLGVFRDALPRGKFPDFGQPSPLGFTFIVSALAGKEIRARATYPSLAKRRATSRMLSSSAVLMDSRLGRDIVLLFIAEPDNQPPAPGFPLVIDV